MYVLFQLKIIASGNNKKACSSCIENYLRASSEHFAYISLAHLHTPRAAQLLNGVHATGYHYHGQLSVFALPDSFLSESGTFWIQILIRASSFRKLGAWKGLEPTILCKRVQWLKHSNRFPL